MRILELLIDWVFSHKLIVFVVVPAVCVFSVVLFVGIIYLSWLGDRDAALKRLALFKQLIDRTEEMKQGTIYSAGEIELGDKAVDIPTRIYDRNGEVIGEYFDQKREIVPFKHIPDILVKEVIASEDREFYNHNGLNYKGIMRALVINMTHFGVSQGGSTVTQQLAKVLFTDMERNIKRKVYEAFAALEIEKHYDKQDIMSMYLNLIYFGNGAYGVEATSKMFFGKSVSTLTETECAMIVAAISNPTVYSPLTNISNSVKKTRRIMNSLVEAKYIDKKRADYQFSQFISKWDIKLDKDGNAVSSLIGTFIYSTYRINRAPFYNELVRRVMVDRFGNDRLTKGGLSINTTIDAKKQDAAYEALKEAIEKQRKYHIDTAAKITDPIKSAAERDKALNIEGALIAINPYTGEIISYVGGYKFATASQFDHVSQGRRQPGSSFKPIIYTAALQSKDITAATMFADESTVFEKNYSPENYDGKFRGNIIVREALRQSVNVVAVKILEKTGYDLIFEYIKKGLDVSETELNNRFGKTLSLALGTYEVTPLENVTLHSEIVNGGQFVKPWGIKNVKDYTGNVLWNCEIESTNEITEKRNEYGPIMDSIACAITVSMLKGVFEPGGTAAGIKSAYNINFPIAGKTGTSTNFNDAWFVGYTSDLVTAVWIGNSKGAISLGRGETGGRISAPAWGRFISMAYNDNPPGEFKVPDKGISYQTIDSLTGKVPKVVTDSPEIVKDELFYEGTEPGEYSE